MNWNREMSELERQIETVPIQKVPCLNYQPELPGHYSKVKGKHNLERSVDAYLMLTAIRIDADRLRLEWLSGDNKWEDCCWWLADIGLN